MGLGRVYVKGMGVGKVWFIRELNGLKCLECKVVGEVGRWEVKKENGF